MHLKRLATPRRWAIERKKNKFIARPLSGSHSFENCITLNMLLKDFLKYAKTKKEIKEILNRGKILINGVKRKDHRFSVGVIDVIEISELNERYRLLYNKNNKFYLQPIDKDETEIKPCKVIGKTVISGGKIQLNLNDGRNIISNKAVKVGDTIVYDLKNKSVKDHIPLAKGAIIYVINGKYTGEVGVVEEIIKGDSSKKAGAVFKVGNSKFETLKDYVIAIGKDKPVIKIG